MSPHLVLVHGNSLSARSWQYIIDQPALKGVSVRALDLPGHGSAARHPEGVAYTLEGFADHVVDQMVGMGPVVLVGHSLGGHICARVLARTDQVQGLVIFGTPLLRSAADIARAFIPMPALAKAYTPQLYRADAEELAEAFTWPGSPEVGPVADDILRTDPRVRGDLGAALASGQLPDEVAMVKTSGLPVRIVHGADDPFIRKDYLDELAQELDAGPVRIMQQAGHSPQLQRPEAMAAILSDTLIHRRHATCP